MDRRIVLSAALLLACSAPAFAQFAWQTATSESQGMSTPKLDALRDNLRVRATSHFLVIRNDKVVYEWYATGQGRTTTHYTASMAKALVGGVSLGVAIHDGRISLDDLGTKYVPQWVGVALKSQIKVRHLGSHTSGIEDAEEGNLSHGQLTGWKGDFWKRLVVPNDPFTISRDRAPVLFTPGTAEAYSNPGIAMLTYCVTSSLKSAPVKDVRTLLRDRIMRPIGAPDAEWNCGYGQTFTVDGLPLVPSWGGGNYSPNATARVARLMLRRGDWEGTRLLSEAAVGAITGDAGTAGNGGQGWWTNSDGTGGKAPKDAFWGAGAGHQVVFVVPSFNLICVRNGETLDGSLSYDAALRAHLFDPLVDSVQSASAPYPASTVITGISWAAASTIVRKAPGSDTWPLTWADDDNLYGAYGDGNGFDPSTPKLSLGLARISGAAGGFTGTNLRSPTAEQAGDGAAGKKASGMLMVGGVLYMWIRNADNAGRQCQLAWSGDRGSTWTWSTWKFAEFGYPTFVNFGKNYAGSRDTYVYTVSHDNPSAYQPANRFILMRVPKDRIRERAAYEFFKSRDASGNATWTTDIAQRGAVFTHAGRCRRSAMTYNPVLKRYLWWQMLHADGVDNRFSGGFGVYDAPEPWGPWTTVYFTSAWDVGPGETGSFPVKWMSPDGKTIHLVFSGEDAFSVRQATLTVPGGSGNAPPSVNVTSPAAGATFPAPATITIQASASDPGGSVSRVEFLSNGVLLGADSTAPYSYTWSNVPAGSYSLTARAVDNLGLSATSSAVSVTVGAVFSVRIDSVSTGRAYALSTAQAGALYYIDRSYTITSIGSALAGGVLLRTSNDDKNVTSSTHLRFTVSGPATVYVSYDKRAMKNPTWLNDGTWTITADVMQVTDGGASPMRVFRKSVGAGQATLGGNQTGGPTGAGSNYVVVIRSTGSSSASFKAVDPDAWEHPGDTDGDGLSDAFEASVYTDPALPDTDGDGDPDESEIGTDGRTLWEAQEGSSPGGGGGGGGGGCGCTGLETLLLALLRRRRFRA